MKWGMRNRLNRIINPETGHTVMFAVDHGYFLGPTTGLEKPWETVEPLIEHADCLMLTRGVLNNCVPPELDKPIVMRVSGGTSIVGPDLLHEGMTCSVKDCIAMNVAGMAYSIRVGAKFERDTILDLAKFVDWGEEYGIPVLAVTAVGKEMAKDARYMALASRIAAEIGAHIVKTYYVEGFERVVDTCPVPIVIAGGKKIPEKDALEMAYNAIQAGAAGVDMGRNIFQSESPVAMVQAVKSVVHEKATPREAFQLFEELKGKGPAKQKKITDDSGKV